MGILATSDERLDMIGAYLDRRVGCGIVPRQAAAEIFGLDQLPDRMSEVNRLVVAEARRRGWVYTTVRPDGSSRAMAIVRPRRLVHRSRPELRRRRAS